MERLGFIFSGQGCQTPGMGKELYEMSAVCKDVFEKGNQTLGFSLQDACFLTNKEELSQTVIAQPAIMAVSIAAFALLKENEISPSAVAGHSLGEYAALYASGAVCLEDVFSIVKTRAAAMQKAAQNQDGMMCAVIGAPASKIEEICKEVTDGFVLPVNYNTPDQTVIAGQRGAVEAVVQKLKGIARRCMPLSVNAAFHTCLMEPAANELFDALQNIRFHAPKIPFYSNTTARQLPSDVDFAKYLRTHSISPVYFVEEITQMHKDGISTFIELGPGKVTANMVRKIVPEAEVYHVMDKTSFENLVAALK